MNKSWVRTFAAVAAILTVGVVIVILAQGQTGSYPTDHGGHAPAIADAQMPGMDMPGMDMGPAASQPTIAPAIPEGLSVVTVGPAIQQRIGVTLGKVEQTPLVMQIRSVGIVRPNETKIAHIHLKTEGWVLKLFVSFTGQKVKPGDPLLSIYSPTFFTAQREFLIALQAAKATPSPDQQIMVEASRRRMELWDVPKEEIESLEKTGKAMTALTLRSPIAGTILEKKAFEGQYVAPQDELYLVADLATVWVQARVYEYELPHVAINMPALVTLPAFPGRQFEGKIAFVDPVVEEPSRTVQVRIELSNKSGELKPGMFANVLISHQMGQGLTVPTSAVIRTGRRDIVYLAESQDRFVPVQVTISPFHFEDRFQVLQGLQAGQTVLTSANFLIDSESRLRAGASAMAGMPGMEGPQTGPAKPAATETPAAPQGQHTGH